MIMDDRLSEILNRIVTRIIESVQPSRIILFGSGARGTMTRDSDFDLLVVVNREIHRRKTAQDIYKNISDVGFASDIIVVTEKDIELYKNADDIIIKPALKEGIVLFAA